MQMRRRLCLPIRIYSRDVNVFPQPSLSLDSYIKHTRTRFSLAASRDFSYSLLHFILRLFPLVVYMPHGSYSPISYNIPPLDLLCCVRFSLHFDLSSIINQLSARRAILARKIRVCKNFFFSPSDL